MAAAMQRGLFGTPLDQLLPWRAAQRTTKTARKRHTNRTLRRRVPLGGATKAPAQDTLTSGPLQLGSKSLGKCAEAGPSSLVLLRVHAMS